MAHPKPFIVTTRRPTIEETAKKLGMSAKEVLKVRLLSRKLVGEGRDAAASAEKIANEILEELDESAIS